MRLAAALVGDGSLSLDTVPGVKEWFTREKYRVSIGGRLVVIPKGFSTDLASVPRFVRFWIDDDDPDLRIPALIHDWLYQRSGRVFASVRPYSRVECDELLVRFMQLCGSNPAREAAVFFGVRVGGWRAWSDYRRSIDKKDAPLPVL